MVPISLPTYMVPPSIPDIMPSPALITYRSAAPMVTIEARTIVITQLSHSVDEQALEALLRGVTLGYSTPGSYCYVKVTFFYHESGERKGERKDHALAIFEDATSAKRAIQALNGYEFQGRCIMVELAKEGARP
jgi:RNA recognition motif-containing protein